MNRNASVESAPSAGPGNGDPAMRRPRYAPSGRRNVPSTVPSLKATSMGTTSDAAAIARKASGK